MGKNPIEIITKEGSSVFIAKAASNINQYDGDLGINAAVSLQNTRAIHN